jgi:hypothetical protein
LAAVEQGSSNISVTEKLSRTESGGDQECEEENTPGLADNENEVVGVECVKANQPEPLKSGGGDGNPEGRGALNAIPAYDKDLDSESGISEDMGSDVDDHDLDLGPGDLDPGPGASGHTTRRQGKKSTCVGVRGCFSFFFSDPFLSAHTL